jgi:prepilin peptidase CpaA
VRGERARGKIYNWLTFPGIALGLVYGLWSGGVSGLGSALGGVVLGLVLYGWMFWIRVMGAGDVKLLMALGAWGGPRFAVDVAVLGVVLGGVLAVLILIARGRIGDFVRRLKTFLMSVLIKELEVVGPRIDHQLKMPFGLSIAGAALWLRWGGLNLW